MNKHTGVKAKGAVEIIAESVHLLRMAPLDLHLTYMIGSLPFVLGLLFFITDMSQNAFAPERCAGGAAYLTAGYIWMKSWQALFAQRLWNRLVGEASPDFSIKRFLALMVRQAIVQPTGFLLLPPAALAVMPLAWVYAFYQNDTALGARSSGKRPALRQVMQMTRLWPLQSWVIFIILSAFSLVVFFNLCMAFLMLPLLLKKVLGIDTVFTISGFFAFNTTLLFVSIGITYLCVDPLAKTAYVLRCFYGSAITTGADLKIELNRLLSAKKTAAVLAIGLLLLIPSSQATANTSPSIPESQINAGDLDRSIDAVMAKPEYTWRLPRPDSLPKEDTGSGPFDALLEWLQPTWESVSKTVSTLFRKFLDWFDGDDEEPDTTVRSRRSMADWMGSVQALLFCLLALAAGMLAIYIGRVWMDRKRAVTATAVAAAKAVPDIADESVSADDLPTDRWLDLAHRMVEKGDYRLALRAVYLASLAFLSDRQMITIAISKSNRDYMRELQRRAHARSSLNNLFAGHITVFDRVWYGMHDVGPKDVENFSCEHERIVAVAQ